MTVDLRPARSVSIVTPTYRNDYELAVALCESVDRFVVGPVQHFLVVPDRDARLFAGLAGPSRTVVPVGAMLAGHGLFALPFPTRLRIPLLVDRALKQQWWCRGAGRQSGWLVQQITKLCAGDIADADVLLFMDSDVVMFRPFDPVAMVERQGVPLFRAPLAPTLTRHHAWCDISRRLLGVPARSEAGAAPTNANYVGQLITWRRDTVMSMRRHIESVTGMPWATAIARCGDISEYMLYGIYCTEVLGLPASGHEITDQSLALSIWTESEVPDPAAFAARMTDRHVAVHIQSTIAMPPRRRSDFVQSIAARAGSGVQVQAAA